MLIKKNINSKIKCDSMRVQEMAVLVSSMAQKDNIKLEHVECKIRGQVPFLFPYCFFSTSSQWKIKET